QPRQEGYQLSGEADPIIINGKPLTVAQVSSVKRRYLESEIWENDQQIIVAPQSVERLLKRREHLQQELVDAQFDQHVLEELQDDTLIQQAIQEDLARQGEFSGYDLNPEHEQAYETLEYMPGKELYADFLREHLLTPDDVWSILAILVRRRAFRAYLQN